MSSGQPIARIANAADIKRVPQDAPVRQAIRDLAGRMRIALNGVKAPTYDQIHGQALAILQELSLPADYMGFAMVAVSNTFWIGAFGQTPYNRRLLLLPHCLSKGKPCQGAYDSVGLNCAGCGSCDIDGIKKEAEELGYKVIVAEGTSSVLMKVLDGEADAVLGVACLDSLEKSFHRAVDMGIPQLALPLLRDGCVNTEAEICLVRQLLRLRDESPREQACGYLPLLRLSARLFAGPSLDALLEAHLPLGAGALSTERIALDWLRDGGKRLRPFITLAAYAVARHGQRAFSVGMNVEEMIPLAVRHLALAIEALHKASLVHDDIEDNDDWRYGRATVHHEYGVGPAVNIGDWLIGLGYVLVAGGRRELGGECAADILAKLGQAHLELCRGQGNELLWRKVPAAGLTPAEVMETYGLKTAPAFEAALYCGLRAAGEGLDEELIGRFANRVGGAFQIANDLDDWRMDERNKRRRGLDVLGLRPTILRAFAGEADGGAALAELAPQADGSDHAKLVDDVRKLYVRTGAFSKAQRLYSKLRQCAMEDADKFGAEPLRELMRFLVRMILPLDSTLEISGHQ